MLSLVGTTESSYMESIQSTETLGISKYRKEAVESGGVNAQGITIH